MLTIFFLQASRRVFCVHIVTFPKFPGGEVAFSITCKRSKIRRTGTIVFPAVFPVGRSVGRPPFGLPNTSSSKRTKIKDLRDVCKYFIIFTKAWCPIIVNLTNEINTSRGPHFYRFFNGFRHNIVVRRIRRPSKTTEKSTFNEKTRFLRTLYTETDNTIDMMYVWNFISNRQKCCKQRRRRRTTKI